MNDIKLLKVTEDTYHLTRGNTPFVYPRVTAILKELGLTGLEGVSVGRLKVPGEFGSHCHKMVGWYTDGVLDETELDPLSKEYLDGYKNFREITSWARDKVRGETLIVSKTHGFAGTFDEEYSPGIIVDLKFGQVQICVKWQLGGYAIGYKETFGRSIKRRYAVQIDPAFKPYGFKIHDCNETPKLDESDFLSFLRTYNVRKEVA